ncbi:hypothetical protein CSAL01_01789 [Colletotrichum salicis]|uniref:Peptidase S8/S53 domain-containing protein n=1 Tax=Colletotrichum salicis TaxID=1209931 RepID=A0A135T6V1_9PEZI|nr:hypothetical protein CSAL01_01789 [Colletotrichum salicis]
MERASTTAGYFRASPDSISVLSTRAVKFTLGTRSFDLPWKSVYLQLLHYFSNAYKKSIDAGFGSSCHSSFTAESYILVFVSDSLSFFDRINSASQSYTVKDEVYRDTVVKPPENGLQVTLEDVECSEDGSEKATHCTEVMFRFRQKEAIESTECIERMKEMLLEQSIKGPVSGENIVFQTPVRGLLTSFSARQTFWHLQYNDIGRSLMMRKKWNDLLDFNKEKHTSRTLLIAPDMQAGTAAARHEVYREGLTSSSRWFGDWEDVEVVLRTPKSLSENNDQYKPIRIAVIDTDVDPSRNLVCKDFVQTGKHNSDQRINPETSQHATQSVDLIYKMYDKAEIVVARVFVNDQADEKKEPYLMAEAIEWAIKEKVDIISISAGFATCPKPLRTAVHAAHAANILIFAAASNWGNTNSVAFPARIKDHIFCMFATTGALKIVPEINPEPRRAADNFALLGQHINLPPHPEAVSGTFVATALAAGTAARILDFVRQTESKSVIKGAWMVQSKAGMTAIFRSLVRKSTGYDCVQPRLLLPTGPDLLDLADSRAHVRRFLHDALARVE